MPENFPEINRYFDLTSYCDTTGQSNNAFYIIKVFFGGKKKSPCFDLFIYSLADKTNNEILTETIFSVKVIGKSLCRYKV